MYVWVCLCSSLPPYNTRGWRAESRVLDPDPDFPVLFTASALPGVPLWASKNREMNCVVASLSSKYNKPTVECMCAEKQSQTVLNTEWMTEYGEVLPENHLDVVVLHSLFANCISFQVPFLLCSFWWGEKWWLSWSFDALSVCCKLKLTMV